MKKFFIIFLSALSLSALASEQYCALLLSDLHMDPFLSSKMPYEPTGRGTDLDQDSYDIFRKKIMETEGFKDADSIFLLGDIVGHALDDTQRIQVMHDIFADIAAMNKTIYVAFGNNDSFQGNYQEYDGINGSPYKIAKSIWPDANSGFSSAKNLKVCDQADQNTYPCINDEQLRDGHYSMTIAKNLRLIVLNSVLFNGDYDFIYQDTADEALGWLSSQLTKSAMNHEQVLIALHVPPVMDLYNKNYHFRDKLTHEPRFQREFISRLRHAVLEQDLSLIAVISSHTHYDETHVIKIGQDVIPVILAPALSTDHGNAVSFKTVCFQRESSSWALDDVTSFKFDSGLDQFKAYQTMKSNLCHNVPIPQCFSELPLKWESFVDYVQRFYYANNKNHAPKTGVTLSDIVNF